MIVTTNNEVEVRQRRKHEGPTQISLLSCNISGCMNYLYIDKVIRRSTILKILISLWKHTSHFHLTNTIKHYHKLRNKFKVR